MGHSCSHSSDPIADEITQKGCRVRRGSVSAEVASAILGKPVIKNVSVKSDEAYDRITESIKSCFLFADLDEDQIEDVILSMVEKSVEEGQVIIKEEDDGDNFYVIEKGIYEASRKEAVLFKYENKGAFGELALMYNCKRAATVTAKSAGILWAVDRCSFRSIIVDSRAQKRKQYEGILEKMPIFRDLSTEKVSVIADCLSRQQYSPGETILSEEEALGSDAKFYIVEKGNIECYKTFENEKKLVKTIENGGFFGEVALISKQNRQADCIAKTETCVLSMGRDAFERLMGPIESILHDRIKEYNVFNENFTNAV